MPEGEGWRCTSPGDLFPSTRFMREGYVIN